MPRIVWSAPSRSDLHHIDAYLTREATPDRAVAVLGAIRERSTFLASFPHGGRPLADGTRLLRVSGTPYLIRYRIRVGVVEVIRVHHERQDWLVLP